MFPLFFGDGSLQENDEIGDLSFQIEAFDHIFHHGYQIQAAKASCRMTPAAHDEENYTQWEHLAFGIGWWFWPSC